MNIRLKLHMYTKRIEELVVNRSDPKRGHDNNFLKKKLLFFYYYHWINRKGLAFQQEHSSELVSDIIHYHIYIWTPDHNLRPGRAILVTGKT